MSKRIRFIEPSFTLANPSTNGLVGVVRQLADEGWDIEVWCIELDPSLEGKVRVKRIPKIPCPAFFGFFINFALIHLMATVELIRGHPKPDKTVTTGFMLLSADYATVHYSHFDWFGQQRRLGFFKSLESLFECLKFIPGLFAELLLFYNPWPTCLLPVSDAVAADLRAWAAPWKTIEVLPNCYHGDRFSPDVRTRHREAARNVHGFTGSDIVLAFVSNGHYYRKGLADAIAATGLLRQRGYPVTLLVIGGRAQTLRLQKRWIQKSQPAFHTWTQFVGQVDDMPFHLSAADAFFFPSRAEAFSLVEIEAAAFGLPLFLTPHHGSEMILKDGINGRLLPWDISAMADILEAEIRKGLAPIDPPDTGKALTDTAYYNAWHRLLNQTTSII